MTSTSAQPSRLPGIIVAAVLFLGVATWGGWAIWSRYSAPDPSQLREFNPAGPGRGRMVFAPAQPPRPVDGVRQRNNGTYAIRAGDLVVTATKPANSNEWSLAFNTNNAAVLTTREQSTAIQARIRLAADAKYAEFLKVTPEQIKQLRQISARTGLVVPEADRAKLMSLFNTYLAAADKSGPENNLVLALKDATPRILDATRAEIAVRAKQIESILTPEQLAPFKQ